MKKPQWFSPDRTRLLNREEISMQFFAFQVHITDECDQRCKHCYIFSGAERKRLQSFSQEEFKEIVANCLDMCDMYERLPYFYITGGDPLLNRNFWQILSIMKENAIEFTIMGNPFHLDYEVCKKLKEYGCEKYQMSLDGLKETHDWFRKPGSFDCTLEKIECIKRAGIRSVIMTTISGKNIEEIPAIVDTVVKHGVDVFAFARYCPVGSQKSNYITAEAYRNLLEICDEKFRAYEAMGCDAYFSRKDHLWTLYMYETGAFTIPSDVEADIIYDGCNCGNSHLTILSNGDIYACRRVPNSKVGNVFEDRLADIWVCEMESYRDYKKFKKCSKCELLAWCRGCPAVAASYSGDFYSSDPQCWKVIAD